MYQAAAEKALYTSIPPMHRALPLIPFCVTLLPKGDVLRTQTEEVSVFMTLDEARLMANVNARAQSLFDSGYRAR